MSTATAPRAADLAAARRLGDVVGRLIRMLRRAHVAPLGSSAMSALGTAVNQGPIRLGELAEREGVTPATLSRVVSVLEREGYVERRTDPDDRRAAFLVVTAEGRGSIEQLRAARGEVLVARMSQLSQHELTVLSAGIDVLERLIADD
jgi:DNA-binding MarR family transcriptional regulator